MPKRRLDRTNRMVSCIGFGGGSRYCNWVADEDALQKNIDHAIKLGITYFDSARPYGDGLAEQRYGKFLTPKYRNQIFLNSKTIERTYDGVVKNIGFSFHKWNDASRRSFDEFDVDAILCVINAPRYNGNEDGLLPLAAKRDVGIIAIKIIL